MKKVLLGMTLIVSTSAFADCSVSFKKGNSFTRAGDISISEMKAQANESLAKKGYYLVDDELGSYTLAVDYTMKNKQFVTAFATMFDRDRTIAKTAYAKKTFIRSGKAQAREITIHAIKKLAQKMPKCHGNNFDIN